MRVHMSPWMECSHCGARKVLPLCMAACRCRQLPRLLTACLAYCCCPGCPAGAHSKSRTPQLTFLLAAAHAQAGCCPLCRLVPTHCLMALRAAPGGTAVEVDRITFERPVNVGDLINFRSWVTRAWPCQHTPGKVGLHG